MSGKCRDCCESDLVKVGHKANTTDWDMPYCYQAYQVYRCKVCGDYWGVRHQYDQGTGHDDRWHRFGPDIATIKRHY